MVTHRALVLEESVMTAIVRCVVIRQTMVSRRVNYGPFRLSTIVLVRLLFVLGAQQLLIGSLPDLITNVRLMEVRIRLVVRHLIGLILRMYRAVLMQPLLVKLLLDDPCLCTQLLKVVIHLQIIKLLACRHKKGVTGRRQLPVELCLPCFPPLLLQPNNLGFEGSILEHAL